MTDINDYLTQLQTQLEKTVYNNRDKYKTSPELEIAILADIKAILSNSQGSGGGGGGGTGDASAENQEIANERLTSINESLSPLSGSFGETIDIPAENTDDVTLMSLVKGIFSTKLGEDIADTTIPAGGIGIRGLLSWIAKLISDRIPELGLQTSNSSLPVVLSTDGVIGSSTDDPAQNDTGNNSLIALFKRLFQVKLPLELIDGRFQANTVGASLDVLGFASAINTNLIAEDVSDYSWISFQLSGTWSATIAAQFSNDNASWDNISVNWSSNALLGTVTANGLYTVYKKGKYFRLRIISYTSGTATVHAQFSNNLAPSTPIQTVAFNTAQAITASSLPLPINAATSALQTTGNTFLSSIDSKFSAAIALTDAITFNPSSPSISPSYLFNGTTWDRARSSGTGRALVDGSGVTQPISATSLPLPAGASSETTLAALNTKFPASAGVSDSLARQPTTLTFGSLNLFDNGSTLVRGRVTSATSGVGLGRQAIAAGTEALTLLSAVTATGAGTSIPLTSGYRTVTAQLAVTNGTVMMINCVIEGSLNGANWYTLATLTDGTNGSQISSDGKVFTFIRANLTTLAGGATINVLASAVA